VNAPPPPTCVQALCGAESLRPFFTRLESLSKLRGEAPVHVLQIGDSHSAGDNISGAWREILQSRYGQGGRGVLPPGRPFAGFTPRGVTVAQSPGWTVQSIFDPAFRSQQQSAVFGISGFRLTALQAGARLALTATVDFAFNRLVICAVTGPGAGAYTVRLGGVATRVSLEAPTSRVDCATLTSPERQIATELVTEGPATFTSWGVFDDNGGVVVSNLGVVGSQLRNFAETDDAAVAEELQTYSPDLIVLEFGTNEGFSGQFDAVAFERILRAQLARLRRLSGGAPLLVMGAPDADTNRADLAHNAGGPAARPAPGAWYPPPALAKVREVQRRVAQSMNVAFWDWSARMGGPATADRWARAKPPLIRADRVHYTVAGGELIARMLQSDMDAAEAVDYLLPN
jgi:lysophospholipase L1-like esterase